MFIVRRISYKHALRQQIISSYWPYVTPLLCVSLSLYVHILMKLRNMIMQI
jgi:hypothetical protein